MSAQNGNVLRLAKLWAVCWGGDQLWLYGQLSLHAVGQVHAGSVPYYRQCPSPQSTHSHLYVILFLTVWDFSPTPLKQHAHPSMETAPNPAAAYCTMILYKTDFVYLTLVNIWVTGQLWNLCFSRNVFDSIRNTSIEHWNFEMYRLMRLYERKPTIPPPVAPFVSMFELLSYKLQYLSSLGQEKQHAGKNRWEIFA